MKEWILSRPDEATKDMLRDAFCTGELIRCCDCVHFRYYEEQFTPVTYCGVLDRSADPTDYCSWGERKTG